MKKLICIAFLPLIIFACKKEDEGRKSEVGETTASYQPLNIGNYWVYEHYQIGPVNEVKNLEIYDSIIISRDTLIGRQLYYVLEGTNVAYGNQQIGLLSLLRDSAGDIIDYTGKKVFSADNFTDTLYSNINMLTEQDTLYTESYSMQFVPEFISVPAGNFKVLDYRGTIYSMPSLTERYIHNYYAEGIGKILSSYFYLSDTSRYFEKRLIRYGITTN